MKLSPQATKTQSSGSGTRDATALVVTISGMGDVVPPETVFERNDGAKSSQSFSAKPSSESPTKS